MPTHCRAPPTPLVVTLGGEVMRGIGVAHAFGGRDIGDLADQAFERHARRVERSRLTDVEADALDDQGVLDVDTNGTLDYWLLTLSGDPVGNYGHLRLDPRPLDADEVIYIPQHPGGSPKKLGIESDQNTGNLCRIDDTNRNGRGSDTDTGYLCDTEGGSSGSPVLAESSHEVVALHHFGEIGPIGSGGGNGVTVIGRGRRVDGAGLLLKDP